MASLATHAHGAAPTSPPTRDHDPGTQAPVAPMVHAQNVSKKVMEKDVRDALAKRLGGETERGTPAGSIDVFTKHEAIEVKHYKLWKNGVGQVISYGAFHSLKNKRLHIFAQKGENASKYVEIASSLVGSKSGVRVTFEKVFRGCYDLDEEQTDSTETDPVVTGQKRLAIGVETMVTKRERIVRSTNEPDAAKLEVLRETHALYTSAVGKECIFPKGVKVSPKLRTILQYDDPKKDLKTKLRRQRNERALCVDDIVEFLKGTDLGICDLFYQAFGGKGDNVERLVTRVNKGNETPQFVWTNAVLSKCGQEECKYCE